MMFDNTIRQTKDYLLHPVAHRLPTTHPTTISLIGLLVGLAAAVALWHQAYLWGLGLWLLNRLLDGFDGTVARVNEKQSDLGGYIDIMLDFVVYAIIPIALIFGLSEPTQGDYLGLAFLLATFYVNSASWMYLSSILEKRNQGAQAQGELTTVSMPDGIIAGTETVVFYCAFIIWASNASLLFTIMGILVMITVVQRLIWAIRHINDD
ncbi:MAG: CDP-alcohol phosphatidyltransferase family protein [Chloroflexota bacterium]